MYQLGVTEGYWVISAEDKFRVRPRARATDPAATASRIVAAAYEVFLEHGFTGATTGLIASRARVSKRSIYTSFTGKDELFAAVVLAKRHIIIDPPEIDEGPEPFIDRLSYLFRLNIGEDESHERMCLLHLINREASISPRLMDYLYESGILRTREVLVDWLDKERARGRVAYSDVQVVASLLIDVVFGALQPRRRNTPSLPIERRRHHILNCLAVVLKGLERIDGQQ